MKTLIRQFILSVFIIFFNFNDSKGSIVINEFMASNESALFDGNQKTPDWIELFNTSTEPVNLENWYLSDDENNLKKWQFPSVIIEPQGYLIILTSGENRVAESELHTNFKLDSDGEAVILSDSDGSIADAKTFEKQQKNHSLGRLSDGFSEWGVFAESSPGKDNLSGILAESNSVKITFSHAPGRYFEPIDLNLNSEDSNVKIHYTTNGDSPTPDDQIFEEAIHLNFENTEPVELSYIPTAKTWQAPVGEFPQFHVIRARAFKDNVPVSGVFSRSFRIEKADQNLSDLPVISIITDSDNLFDYEKGIYIIGQDYNFNKRGIESEKPAHIEYFDADHQFGFSQNLGIRITGNTSRNMPQKSLKLYPRTEYGDNRIRYPLFGENYDSTFKRLKLRNINGDRNGTGLTDDLAHEIIAGKVNTDYSMHQFVIVYINGEYWGIHSMRESLDEHLFARRFDTDNDDISLGHAHKFGFDTINGSLDNYFELTDFVRSNDLNNPENYEYIASKIDIENLQETFITQIFLANSDWPHHNNRFWQINNPESRWRWIFFDLDAAFKSSVYDNFGFIFQPELEASQFTEPEDYELINYLMQNQSFALSFRDKMYELLDNVFAPERTVPIFENLVKRLEPEMEKHIRRWNFPRSPERWEKDLGDIKDFLVRRPHFLNGALSERLGIPLKTFPNPAQSVLNYELELTENQEIKSELMNVSGDIFSISKQYLNPGTHLIQTDIPKQLPTGIYYLNVRTKRRVLTDKIVIVRE